MGNDFESAAFSNIRFLNTELILAENLKENSHDGST